MKQLLYKVNHRLKKIYWFIFRPKTIGVKCVIENRGRLLMIKRTLPNSKWVFPGGAVMANESFKQAIEREIKEDLGLALYNIQEIGNFTVKVHSRLETLHCFLANCQNTEIKGDEVKLSEIKWFLPDELPQPLTPISHEVFYLYKLVN